MLRFAQKFALIVLNEDLTMYKKLKLIILVSVLFNGGIMEVLADAKSLEGDFGNIVISSDQPEVISLKLKNPAGHLEPRSLLSEKGLHWQRETEDWATGAYSYVVDNEGVRYESRNFPAGDFVQKENVILLKDVLLAPANQKDQAVACENWRLFIDGQELVWQIERTWLNDFEVRLDAAPGLFSSLRAIEHSPAKVNPNGATHVLWSHPDQLQGRFESFYRPAAWHSGFKLSRNNVVNFKQPGAWAIAKLWTTWNAEMEPRFQVGSDDYLSNRGHFGWRNEVAVVHDISPLRKVKSGQIEKTELRISAIPADQTGYQMQIDLPDKKFEHIMTNFHRGLLNGGLVNDQLNFDFGNETNGWYYGGASVWRGFAIMAGIPASNKRSEQDFEVWQAYRHHLERVIGTSEQIGRTGFGYNWGGYHLDTNLYVIIGVHKYLMHTGDLPFVRQQLPALEIMMKNYTSRQRDDGLFDLGHKGHQYYDVVHTSGINGSHNAFFYKGLLDLADLQIACGNPDKANQYRQNAARVKEAFNKVLWNEDLSGGPRYIDEITHDGKVVSYGADMNLFPPVAFGIADEERAKKLFATIDKRIAEIRENEPQGYVGLDSLSAYWPVPEWLKPFHAYPDYMNGGSFFGPGYWEILARCRYGDTETAMERLRAFADGSLENSNWCGNNWITRGGKVGHGAIDEPYLSDMVVTPSAIIFGLMGVQPTWDDLKVVPQLPTEWKKASAEIVYKGKLHRIEINDGEVTIEEKEKMIDPSSFPLVWRVGGLYPLEWQTLTDRPFTKREGWHAGDQINTHQGNRIALRQEFGNEDETLLANWVMKADGNKVEDRSGRQNTLRVQGGVEFLAESNLPIARFAGTGSLITPAGDLAFNKEQDFTIWCRFRSNSQQPVVMLSRPGHYCLYLKDGKLTAWLMGDGTVFKEVQGTANAADGNWHEAAAVIDRSAKVLRLYIDNQPQGEVDISAIPESSTAAGVSIGSLGGGYPFHGDLSGAAIYAEALSPTKKSFAPPAATASTVAFAETGTYRSGVFNWGQKVSLKEIVFDADLNSGEIEAILISANDKEFTDNVKTKFTIKNGFEIYPLEENITSNFVQLEFKLNRSEQYTNQTPVLKKFEIRALP